MDPEWEDKVRASLRFLRRPEGSAERHWTVAEEKLESEDRGLELILPLRGSSATALSILRREIAWEVQFKCNGGIMGAEKGTDALRLYWSARGLAYLLSKHGIERPLPITFPSDGAAR